MAFLNRIFILFFIFAMFSGCTRVSSHLVRAKDPLLDGVEEGESNSSERKSEKSSNSNKAKSSVSGGEGGGIGRGGSPGGPEEKTAPMEGKAPSKEVDPKYNKLVEEYKKYYRDYRRCKEKALKIKASLKKLAKENSSELARYKSAYNRYKKCAWDNYKKAKKLRKELDSYFSANSPPPSEGGSPSDSISGPGSGN